MPSRRANLHARAERWPRHRLANPTSRVHEPFLTVMWPLRDNRAPAPREWT